MDTNLSVLLVDDDDIDVMAVQRAFGKTDIDVKVARDGIEGLEVLRGKGEVEPLPMPHVILLDVNMPRLDGHGFLQELRNDPELRNRVVFMLTTSEDPGDRAKAYDKQVAGYFHKVKEG